MPHLATAGASLHYEVAGQGPPLLLIAGIASDSASWAPLVPLLSARFRLIMPDNRGSGRTQCAGVLNVSDMVGDCIALLDHLHVGQAGVVGHSLGGMIGHRLAAHHPDRVDKLVTLACAGAIGDKERVLFKDMARLYARIEPQLWFRLLYQWLFADPAFYGETAIAAAAESSAGYPYRQSPRDFARQVDAIDRMRPVPIEAIRCEVLAIAAERDIIVAPAVVAASHRLIGRLTVLTIPAAGHSVHWEAPLAVAEAISSFLAG